MRNIFAFCARSLLTVAAPATMPLGAAPPAAAQMDEVFVTGRGVYGANAGEVSIEEVGRSARCRRDGGGGFISEDTPRGLVEQQWSVEPGGMISGAVRDPALPQGSETYTISRDETRIDVTSSPDPDRVVTLPPQSAGAVELLAQKDRNIRFCDTLLDEGLALERADRAGAPRAAAPMPMP